MLAARPPPRAGGVAPLAALRAPTDGATTKNTTINRRHVNVCTQCVHRAVNLAVGLAVIMKLFMVG